MPLVSVGIPVFNGERFLERAIDSVLAQSITGIEVILVNNASTDATDDICRAAAARDERVRYVVQERNVGAAANFNRALELAHGEYFCWLAHDDWMARHYLERCLEELLARDDVVVCSSLMGVADESGQVFREQSEWLAGADSASAKSRYHSMIWTLKDPTAPVFGVMRTDVVRQAGGIPTVPEPDRQLLYDLSLRGGLRVVADVLFFHYGPPGHTAHYGHGPLRRRSWEWLNAPGHAGKVMAPVVRILGHQLRVVARSDLPTGDRLACAVDVLASTLVLRTRSKVRRFRRNRSGKRAWISRPGARRSRGFGLTRSAR